MKTFLNIFLPSFNGIGGRAALRFLYRHTKAISAKKGDVFFHRDGLATTENIVILSMGLVNGYIMGPDNEQIDIWLGAERSIYIDNGSGSDYSFSVAAVEDSTVFLLNINELEEGFPQYPAIGRLYDVYIFQNAMIDLNNRNRLFRLQDAKSRASMFNRLYPGVYDRLPRELINSYIGYGY